MKKKIKPPKRRRPAGNHAANETGTPAANETGTPAEPKAGSLAQKVRVARQLAKQHERNGQTLDALRQLDRVIELGAADAAVWMDTGRLLDDHREPIQAIGAYQNAISMTPDDPQPHHEIARCFFAVGNIQQAAEHLERAIALCGDDDPEQAAAPWLALATMAPSHPGFDHQRVLQIRQRFAETLTTASAAKTESSGETQSTTAPVAESSRTKKRIGFVSSWFDKDNYMRPVWALVNRMNRSKYEIHLFSDTAIDSSGSGYVSFPEDRIHDTRDQCNHDVRNRIRANQIDLLIDLNAFSTPERLGLFSQALSCPVAAWFNMFATSGLPGIDFIVGDDAVVRKSEEPFYSEHVIRLPQSYLTFEVKHQAPPIVDPPCLERSFVTFGSLVSLYKIHAGLLDSWAKILSRCPGSQLVLGNADLDSPTTRQMIIDHFVNHGIEADRILLRGRAKHYDFLKYYDEIDIALDSFPYNGGTTTTEAIWQGVPVVTFDGDRWASRTSASLLYQTHLKNWIADSLGNSIEHAVQMATRRDRNDYLREMRHTMRDRLLESPVCDALAFTRAMESAIDQMIKPMDEI
ncbi:MAG: hypothetical protein AAF958_10950 [Planctomycetota bacterium]